MGWNERLITLCVLFNHAYPQNIPFLRHILRPRFQDVLFIQPTLRSDDPDVLTSYRGSYNFEGFIADHSQLLLSRKSDHYVFIHDDVLLNPLLNESNIIDRLKVGRDGCFITHLNAAGGQINGPDYRGWSWIVGVLWKLLYPTNTLSGSGIQSLGRDLAEMASRKDEVAELHKLSFPPFTYDRASPFPLTDPFGGNDLSEPLTSLVFRGLFGETDSPILVPPIPLCTGYSDFVVIDGSILGEFLHTCGIFAAANIFAEVAIPTTLAFVARQITQLNDVAMQVNWSYDSSVGAEKLIDDYRSGLLLSHPVKMSAESAKVLAVCEALNVI